MIDALEAERDAAKKNIAINNPVFTCEPWAEKTELEPPLPQRTVDEPTP
ncbi:MAG TPA: hypothetical protein VFL53_08325 [Pseudolabrys sp.]|nr:hypothetical protein [Pseudolabrys sp.]